MTFVSEVELINFRCHEKLNISLNPNVTIITGKNGSGKTSIIEAIYILATGKSFKSSLKDTINIKFNWYSLKATINNDEIKNKISFQEDQYKKEFNINNNKYKTIPNKNKKPVVLFEPEDMRIINGSPNRRRDYLDKLICQYNTEYNINLNKYNKALKQRNYLLKKPNLKKEELFVWDLTLSEYGSYIIKERIETVKLINTQIKNIYKKLSNTEDDIKINYTEDENTNSKQLIFDKLQKSFTRDKIIGSTSIGPHRDDILIYINKKEAKQTASRGESRTIMLALKFFEIEIIEKNTGEKPIILLDDVYSELDEDRQRKLNDFTKNHQVVITSTQAIDNINNIQI